MKFKIGAVMIIMSSIGSLNPYFLVFTVPLFIIGAVFMILSAESPLTKACFVGLPPILLTLGIAGTYFLGKLKKEVSHIDLVFPEDFAGKAVIVPNMNCGQSASMVEGRVQLIFPENGILLYSGDIDAENTVYRYYFRDNMGRETNIPKIHTYASEEREADPNGITVWKEAVGSRQLHHFKSVTKYTHYPFIVSSKEDRDQFRDHNYQRFLEHKTDSLVLACVK